MAGIKPMATKAIKSPGGGKSPQALPPVLALKGRRTTGVR